MAKEQPITVDDDFFIGTDYALVCTVKNAAETAAENITGWTLSWKLHRYLTAAAVLTKTTTSGITLTDAANGVCTVTIEDTDTDGFKEGVYYHELKRTNAGFETVLLFGPAVLKRAGHTS